MSNHNIGFYEDLTKLSFNYHQISSNTRLIKMKSCWPSSLKVPEKSRTIIVGIPVTKKYHAAV